MGKERPYGRNWNGWTMYTHAQAAAVRVWFFFCVGMLHDHAACPDPINDQRGCWDKYTPDETSTIPELYAPSAGRVCKGYGSIRQNLPDFIRILSS